MTDRQFERRIKMIQQGDKQGLKEIYDEYGKMIYQCAFQILHSPHDAEDVTSNWRYLPLWRQAQALACHHCKKYGFGLDKKEKP